MNSEYIRMSFAVRTITHVLENASTDRAVYGVEGEDTVGEGDQRAGLEWIQIHNQ